MSRKKLLRLDKLLESKILDFGAKTQKSHESALEISKEAAASPSKSGDREHAVNQAIINKERLEKLKELKREIDISLSGTLPLKVEPASYIVLEYEGEKQEFYLVRNVVSLDDIDLLSTDSPLGRAILGKKEGDTFEVLLDDKVVNGKVVKIE